MLDKTKAIADLKVLLDIADDDAQSISWITLQIDMVESDIKAYCRNTFLNDSGEYEFPTEFVSPLLKLVAIEYRKRSFEGKNSESVGDYSVSFGTEMPKDIRRILNTKKLMVVW